MLTNQEHVQSYFSHVIYRYNRNDIHELLAKRLDVAAPLLACTVNGIDTIGGMISGFAGSNSKQRSTEFMVRYFSLDKKLAEFVYTIVRCGLAHEGVPKLALRFFVYYERVTRAKFLYKDWDGSIWLNVTELAWSYVDALETISKDIPAHLNHVPAISMHDASTYRSALSLITDNVQDFPVSYETWDAFIPLEGRSGRPSPKILFKHFEAGDIPP
jgi:hypothetical protein